jgi:hypothetical protein
MAFHHLLTKVLAIRYYCLTSEAWGRFGAIGGRSSPVEDRETKRICRANEKRAILLRPATVSYRGHRRAGRSRSTTGRRSKRRRHRPFHRPGCRYMDNGAANISCSSRKTGGGAPWAFIKLSSASHAGAFIRGQGRRTDCDVVAHRLNNPASPIQIHFNGLLSPSLPWPLHASEALWTKDGLIGEVDLGGDVRSLRRNRLSNDAIILCSTGAPNREPLASIGQPRQPFREPFPQHRRNGQHEWCASTWRHRAIVERERAYGARLCRARA